MRRLLLVCSLLLSSTLNAAPAQSWTSPLQRVPMLELFTSHGCSSCPPADEWLRDFVNRDALWQQVIPVAFHVDYWDGLGWADRFANREYSQRQRAYQRSGGVASVYTPGFVVAGKEWRGWFRQGEPPLAAGPEVGRLSMTADNNRPVAVQFKPLATGGGYRAHVAILGFGISSRIGGGENGGRVLKEDFVLLGLSSGSSRADATPEWQLPWPETVSADTSRRALIAWVSRGSDPTPLQAVGGWLDK